MDTQVWEPLECRLLGWGRDIWAYSPDLWVLLGWAVREGFTEEVILEEKGKPWEELRRRRFSVQGDRKCSVPEENRLQRGEGRPRK